MWGWRGYYFRARYFPVAETFSAMIQWSDDTHPCPNDRFRLTRRIAGAKELPATGMVWDLFKTREALTNEMTSLIQSEVHSG